MTIKKRKAKPVRTVKESRGQIITPDADYGDYGVPTPDAFGDLAEAYAVHVWVYACVRAIALNAASVEILPYQKKPDGSWIVDEKHEFFPILQNPNPYMSGYNLREYTVAALKLTGNAYWALERLGKRDVQEIWPIVPSAMRAVSTRERLVDHYVYEINGKKIRFEFEDVIHFRTMNPSSFIYGQGALAAAKNTVATDIFAQVWNKAFFQNSARPDGVLETDDVLMDEVRNRTLEGWRQMFRGASKHGKTAILEGKLKYKPISESAKDMDFVNLRKDLRVEILAAFGVPPSIVGLLEYANYSNMEQQFKAFWTNTLLPELKNIENTLTVRARQISFRAGTIFQADTSSVAALQPDLKIQAETARAFIDAGFPPNAVIDALDLPFEHIEGGDVPRAHTAPAPAFLPSDSPEKAVKSAAAAPPAHSDHRIAVWKVFDDRLRNYEGRLQSAMRGFFSAQRKRTLRKLEQNRGAILAEKTAARGQTKELRDAVNLIFDIDAEAELMRTASGRMIRGAFFDFAVRSARAIDPTFDFNLDDPVALNWIEGKVLKLVREANAYTQETLSEAVVDSVQDALAAGFSDAETIDQIVDRINDAYQFAVEHRAERIARTEIVSAANAGSLDGMKKTGVSRKEWLSSKDDRVRESHQQMDGQPRGIDEAFLSPAGAALRFPGDPEGPAEEIIQCRCTVIPVRDR